MEKEHVRAHVIISGKVQGVFFRLETKRRAERLGVLGWVKNIPNKRVEAVFEGEKDTIIEMLEWCNKGAKMSRVDEVLTYWENYTGKFDGFEVRF